MKTKLFGRFQAGLAVVVLGLASVVMTACLSIPAYAQENESGAALAKKAITTEDLKDLVATIENEGRRAELLKQLKVAVAAREAKTETQVPAEDLLPVTVATELVEKLSGTLTSLSKELAKAGQVIVVAPKISARIQRNLESEQARTELVGSIITLGTVIGIGALLWGFTQWALRRPRLALDRLMSGKNWRRWVAVSIKLLLDFLPPLMLTAASWAMLIALNANRDLTNTATLIMGAVAALQVVLAMSSTLLSPKTDSLRVVGLGAESAQYVAIWVRRIATVAVVGYSLIQALSLLGLPRGSEGALDKLLGLVLVGMLVVFTLQNRSAVAQWLKKKSTRRTLTGEIRKGTVQRVQKRLAEVWHLLTVFYIIALYVVWATEIKGGFMFMIDASIMTVIVIAVALVLSHLVRKGLEKAFAVSAENKERFPRLEMRVNRYVPAIYGIIRFLIIVVAVLAVLQVWGVDALVWLTSESGRHLTESVVTVGVVLLVALVVWEFANAWIERYLSAADSQGKAIQRSARAKTLLPLARNILLVALIVLVTLIVLSTLGINIAPLLAGAGVVGLAIGFGSQKLVQDVITGAFILFEDAISVGDVVEVGGKSGTVEGITIRSIRLRDVAGAVHTIPFSAVDKVTNMTKDFSYYVINMGIAYDADTDVACDIMVGVAEEVRSDPAFGASILEPLEILGVDQFGDSAVMIKARIKTLPIKQWMVGREFNRRLKKAFDAQGIEIPFPHVTVYFGDAKKNPDAAQTIIDAATGAAGAGADKALPLA